MSERNKPDRRVCLGQFAGAHGVRGEAKVKTFTDAPLSVAIYGPVESEDNRRRFTLTVLRVLKTNLVLVRSPEIRSREDAAALSGVKIYVDRAALPDTAADEFYCEDLVGLEAVSEEGALLGRVVAVHNFGAGDILELEACSGGAPMMIPFTKITVPEVDLAVGRLSVASGVIAEASADESGDADTRAYTEAAMREEDA